MTYINRIINKYSRFKKKYAYRTLAKQKGGRIGKDTRLVIEGDFTFGERFIINSEGIDSYIGSHVVVRRGASLCIGDDTGMSQVSINCRKSIRIGSHVKIGAGTMIFDSNFHSIDWRERRDRNRDKDDTVCASIIIEDDVFIGARSIIAKGVKVGARSIIAAGSVVIKDIPSDCIAGGNPCEIIKSLKKDSYE